MKRITKTLALLSALALVLPQKIHAASEWTEGVCTGTSASSERVASIRGIVCLMENVLSVAITFIGIITFIMILVGGFRILVSSDDPKATEAGKQNITTAITGLVIAVLSWFIIQLIANITGSQNITDFTIPVL